MHLKKLALSGFKTFADETTLELGPGLTAIVGPNGSGKSNIVDAMLWALGERSNKSLRAQVSSDVIFSGSGDRKAGGMAEVSLFFDNADRALPLAFDEVQVTRRLFRDGDTQYSINKTPCRLRDVLDLFLDTGLGPDAYSIVSQSEIDAILSAKPEDRRALLESAAGVQKYRARRSETRRKLERVDADLLRVGDITSELESQLVPLEQAAQAAREFESLSGRLKYLQLALLARDYEARLKRLEQLRVAQETSTNRVLEALASIEELEGGEARFDARLRELEGVMDALGSESTEVVGRLKSSEGELAVARERRRSLSEQAEFLAQEAGLLAARAESGREQLKERRRELELEVRASGALANEAAQAEARLNAANAQLQEATRELQTLQSRALEMMRQSQRARESAASGRAQSESLHSRVAELEKLLAGLEAESAQAAAARAKAQADLEALRISGRQAAEKIEAARAQVLATQKNREARAQALGRAREERSSISSRGRVLRELEQSLEGIQGGARSVLAAIKRGQLSEDYVLVADAIRAPSELESAVEIALGGAVHNLICERESQAKHAIRFLKEGRGGRATFLPLDALRPSQVGERTRAILRENGVRGLASELVECQDSHRHAVKYLLGRVVVVDDLDVATRLASKCDFGAHLVTLDGDLVLPAGAITGGQGRQKSGGLLARKRELDEIEERAAALDKAVAEHEAQVLAAQSGIEAAQAELRREQEGAGELKSQAARAEREVEHLERESRRIKANAQAATHELNNARQSLEAKSGKQSEHEAQAAKLEESARGLDERIRDVQVLVAQRQGEREEVAASIATVRAEFSGVQERLSGMKRAIAEGERALLEVEAQVRARRQASEKARGEDAILVEREADLVSRVALETGRRADLEARSQAGRAERAEVVAKLGEANANLKRARLRLHGDEEELHRVEVRLASGEAEVAEMERRLREEFEIEPEKVLEIREPVENRSAVAEEIRGLQARIAALGLVNAGAIEQHQSVRERLEYLLAQCADLETAKSELEAIITEVDGRTRERFLATFNEVRGHFDELFKRVFGGGQTFLALSQPDNLLETGVELRVQPPGKAAQDIALLSGGERALTALTFMLALLKTNPSPFVVLDEVDAPLDQSNVGRFTALLREFIEKTQFLVITHNNGTMQASDVLYGVTMQKPGVSTVMSVRLV